MGTSLALDICDPPLQYLPEWPVGDANRRRLPPLSKRGIMKRVSYAVAIFFALGLSACTNPYDPGQRAIGGGLLGAGAGAAIGGAAAGGSGAATGALIGGALGAVTGAATTPAAPRTCWDPYYRRYYRC